MKTKMDIGKRWYRSGVVMRFAAGASAFAILQVPLGAEVTFERVTGGAIAEHPDAFSGCAWGDYDGDGFVDLFASGGGGRDEQALPK